MDALSKRERLERAIAGEEVDRIPVALWRHFPGEDRTAEGLAAATLRFQREFDLDLVKVTPASSFCLQDWGVRDEWRGNMEGTREYTARAVHTPDDWGNLALLDPRCGALGEQLRCLEMIVRELGPETPVVQTIFSPLAQAKNLAGGERMLLHLRRHPEQLRAGLERITETTIRFIEASKETGIAGIFYAVQHAQYSLLSEAEYAAFGRPYDLRILEAAGDLWLNILHLHGSEVMFTAVVDYPVQVLNWHDRESGPSLAAGQRLFPGAVCGGLSRWETLVCGTPEQIEAEARDAIAQTGGRRFILGTGCVVPVVAPWSAYRLSRIADRLSRIADRVSLIANR